MPAWVETVIVALPYIERIAKYALPVFRKKTAASGEDPQQQQARQIEELQAAVTANAEHVRALAQQLQAALLAVEQAAQDGAAARRRLRWTLAALAVVSVAALVLALLALRR